MGSCYLHLSVDERRKLAKWCLAKIPKREIAMKLKRNPSTLYRELKRNTFKDTEMPELNGYHAIVAQTKYEERRAIHRKLVRHPNVKAAVVDRLKEGWSPEQIAGRMKLEDHPIRVSHETIYRFAYSKLGRSEELYRHLPEHRRKRRPRGMRKHHGQRFPQELWIKERPDVVAKRKEFGHWEADLIQFRKVFGKGNVGALVERVSRYSVLFRNNDRQSKPVMNAIINALAPLPFEARRSITFDRGTEFAAWDYLQAGIGADVWFCDPQAPWQKGSVENGNLRARRYLPRETDPMAITSRHLGAICDRLNATPRKCLGYKTPAEVFRAKLMEATGLR